MELYLDSANLQEIEKAFELGFLTGLTTTPTFMHKEGVRCGFVNLKISGYSSYTSN